MPTKTLPRFLLKTTEGTPEDFDDDPVEKKDGFIELISCLPSGEQSFVIMHTWRTLLCYLSYDAISDSAAIGTDVRKKKKDWSE